MTAKEEKKTLQEREKKIIVMLIIKMVFLTIFAIAITILPGNDLANGIALAVPVLCVRHTGKRLDELDIIQRALESF